MLPPLPTVTLIVSPRVMSIETLWAGSHLLIAALHNGPSRPPFLPPNTASSSRRWSTLALESVYNRAVPLPRKKLPGHSAVSAARQPLTSTPSTEPLLISNTSAPAHHPSSGSPCGPAQQGHSILQLQHSIISVLICQLIALLLCTIRSESVHRCKNSKRNCGGGELRSTCCAFCRPPTV